MTGVLSEREQAILRFESQWPQPGSVKEEAIRVELALAPARYYQLLGRLIDTEAALAYDPMLVARLRRMHQSSAQRRTARVVDATL